MGNKWNLLEINALVQILSDYSDRLDKDGCNDLTAEEKILAKSINLEIEDPDEKIKLNTQLVDYLREKIKNISFESKE